MGMSRKGKSGRNDLYNALRFFSQIALSIIACVAIGVFLGIWLDRLLGTSPWLLLAFSFLGMGAAFKSIIELGKR
jgi:ATP synthase protein I